MTIIQSTSHSPTFNLAAEEYLFAEREDDLLFLYVNETSVIIGSNQAIQNEINAAFCAENNIQIVRRMSGGGAVYHDSGNLNYSFIKNKNVGEFPLGGEFLQPIVQVLNQLKIDVYIGKRKDLWLPDKHKISGTASHIGKTRELHHGTLLYDSDLEKLQKALTPKPVTPKIKAIASVPSPVKNIRSFLRQQGQFTLSPDDFFQLLTRNLLDIYCTEKISLFSEEDILKIKQLQLRKYESVEWTNKK